MDDTRPLRLPPPSCPLCLVGAHHACAGWLVVQSPAGRRRDVVCRCRHASHAPTEADSAARIADIPIQIGAPS